jgi:hypothetical protein
LHHLGTVDASNVSYNEGSLGAVNTSVQAKLRESVSVKDFGALGDGVDDYAAILACWTYCLANERDMYFPAGTYSTGGEFSMPMGRINGLVPASLLDCKNVTIFGDGWNTILKTVSAGGADVLQFNGAKNLHVRDLMITAELTGFAGAGSNAVSITSGGVNLTFNNVYAENPAYVDKTTYLDGGKGFTIQFVGGALEIADISFINCKAKGCVFGFDVNPVLDTLLYRRSTTQIINCIADECWVGFIASSPASGVAIPAGFSTNTIMKGAAVNCQHGLTLGRVHGGEFSINVINNKSKAGLLLDYNGTAWSATLSPLVDALACTYAQNAQINVYGYVNTVDHKAIIGGTTAGLSGLSGATDGCKLYLDIGGTADISDILVVDSGGNTLRKSALAITSTTSATIPADFFDVTKFNTLQVIGSYGTSALPGNIQFPATQVPSTDPNCFDDYKEGSFTPILADINLTDEGATYSTNNGYYTKHGNTVTFTMTMVITGIGTLTGANAAYVIGLPYPAKTATGQITSLPISSGSAPSSTSGDVLCALIGSSDQYISLMKWPATGTGGPVQLTIAELGTTGSFVISGSYFAVQ